MASANVVEATDSNFGSEVEGADKLTLVDFWAEWCGPCKMLGPVIDQLADEYTGKVKICKMDVDANPQTPMKFAVRGIPTMILFKGGQVVEQLVGNQPKSTIEEALQKHM